MADMITFKSSGSFNKTESFLDRMRHDFVTKIFKRYGDEGVKALQDWTPKDSGLAADSWYYTLEKKHGGRYSITWRNSDIENGGYHVAIMIQYGHATGTGGWVEGYDYINPALEPIFEKIKNDIWNEVKHG